MKTREKVEGTKIICTKSKSEVYLFPTESLVRQDRVFTLVHRMLKGSNFGDHGMESILSHSGFDWDDTKYIITIDDENAWTEYVSVSSIIYNI